jgi:hypothetical protein
MADDIEALKAKLKARAGRPGFKANEELLRKRIAELEGQGDAD